MSLTTSTEQLLPDHFIYKPYSDKFIKTLYQLPNDVIFKLVQKWLNDPVCQPNLDWSEIDLSEYSNDSDSDRDDGDDSQSERNKRKGVEILKQEYNDLETVNIPKRSLVQRILYDHWPLGLNMSQIAQIDISSFTEGNSSSNLWTCSTTYSSNSLKSDQKYEHIVSHIEPKSFLARFNEALYPLVVGHVSAHQHPTFAVVIVRVQIFETLSLNELRKINDRDAQNKYKTSIPPIYLSFPLSSPHIIHSYPRTASGDAYIKAVFYALILTLSRPGRLITLKQSSEIPNKSFNSLVQMKGAKRGIAALGPWTKYGLGHADPHPLDFKKIIERKRKRQKETEVDFDCNEKSINKKLINLRFYGQKSDPDPTTKDAAFIKIPTLELKIEEKFKTAENKPTANQNRFTPTLTTRFEGNDVFEGMKMLALAGVLDITKAPKWLIEQHNATSGTIKNGKYKPGLRH